MRIGELARLTGTSPRTLRFYEDAGVLAPSGRSDGGYREYGPEAAERLDFVRRGQAAGLTLAQIREVMEVRDGGSAPCRHVRDLLDRRLVDLDRQLADLEQLRRTVAGLRDAAHHADPAECSAESVCRYL